MDKSSTRPSLHSWLLAIRPKTLPASVAPVLVGLAVAYSGTGNVAWIPALACLAGAMLLQIGSNLANDYFDFKKGADTPDRLGPTRVTQAGLISERQILIGMVITFLLATTVGVYLLMRCGMPIVYIGLACIAAAILYTGGPLPYGYKGLGEIFVFLFFGPVAVVGTEFVLTGKATFFGGLASVPSGLLCANVLVVNNLRDREQDLRSNKRTLIALYGRRFGLNLYLINFILSLFAIIALLSVKPSIWIALPIASTPLFIRLYQHISRSDGRALNPLLGETARFQLIFCAIQAAALIPTVR